MAMTSDQQNILTNEARRQDLRQGLAAAKREYEILSAQQDTARSSFVRAQQKYLAKVDEFNAFEASTGPGISTDFGPYSTTDQALQKERDAGKSAMIDYVKAHPTATEDDVVAQWSVAALASRPQLRQWLLHDPRTLRREYSANLYEMGYAPDQTWESFRAFVVATEKATLMTL